MTYFGHGGIYDEDVVQAASQTDHTVSFVVGVGLILLGLVLLSRYYRLRPKSRTRKKK